MKNGHINAHKTLSHVPTDAEWQVAGWIAYVQELCEFIVRDISLFVFSKMQKNELRIEVERYSMMEIGFLKDILKLI